MLVGEDFIYEHFYVDDVKMGQGREIKGNFTYEGGFNDSWDGHGVLDPKDSNQLFYDG
jgi:hypothetical protein